jgi:hypothetical protein
MKAVEPAGIGDKPRPFRFEHLPDRLLAEFGMAMCLGVSDALVDEPAVHLL